MATKFADLAKTSTDLLTEDYTTKVTLKCKKNAGPVAVTIETEQGEGGALASKIGTKFAYAKFNVDKGQIKADGGRILETSLAVTPEIKLSFKANKGADLGLDYTKGSFYATGVVDVLEMSKISSSACLALPKSGLKLGGEATYALKGGTTGLTAYGLGAAYAKGPIAASVVTAGGGLSKVQLGLVYKVSPSLTLASQTVHSNAKMCDFVAAGAAYQHPTLGLIKAKVAGSRTASVCLTRAVAPGVMLTASADVTQDLAVKPGLTLSM